MSIKTTLLAIGITVPVAILSVSGIAKIYYEHTHIQQDEITVNNQTIIPLLNKEISETKHIGPIVSSSFACIHRGPHIFPVRYTVSYNSNGSVVQYSVPNPMMLKRVVNDALIHNNVVPYNDTIVDSRYHITPIADNSCNVSYDVKWQNTNYDTTKWFYKIW